MILSAAPSPEDPVVGGVRHSLGHRYARLAGGRRFAAAVPVVERRPVHHGTELPVFPQLPSRLAALLGPGGDGNPQDEDAFFLNVWSPAGVDRGSCPVVVFVHGGAWTSGGGVLPWYDGSALAREGLVVVTVNYRLGPVGHLADTEAETPVNLPLGDLLGALAWVQSHIAAFGGDPARVTLAGQSAGGSWVHALSVLPAARGLFRRVALWSMGVREPWTVDERSARIRAVRAEVGGRALGEVPLAELLAASASVAAAQPRRPGYVPAPHLPVTAPDLPSGLLDPDFCAAALHVEAVLIETMRTETGTFLAADPAARAPDEGVLAAILDEIPLGERAAAGLCRAGLSAYEQLVLASTWRQFRRFPTILAARYRAAGITVVEHVLHEPCPVEGVGAGHCTDLPYRFGVRDGWADAPVLRGVSPTVFEARSAALRARLVRFASA